MRDSAAVIDRLDRIIELLARGLHHANQEHRTVMATLQEIQDKLAANATATAANTNRLDSALIFIAGINDSQTALRAQVADLQALLAAGGAITQQQLDELGASVDANVEATAAETAKAQILLNTVDDDPNT